MRLPRFARNDKGLSPVWYKDEIAPLWDNDKEFHAVIAMAMIIPQHKLCIKCHKM